MSIRRLVLLLPGLLFVALTASGCVAPSARSTAAAGAATANDPFENTNRAIFRFNERVDHAVLIPAAKAYRTVLPPPVRESVHDFLQNLNEPVIFANDVLQGQPKLASQTFARLLINTTVGVGGMFDVASRVGIPFHPNDLGVTLATWGLPEGPYLIIPVMGPSNPRDLAGEVGDSFADPGDYFAGQYHRMWASVARAVVSGIDVRSRNLENLADIERTSLDYYATIRSLYRQRREALIRHEQMNLPNPTTLQSSDAGPEPALSFTIATVPPLHEASAK